jgi:hypothetical protein
MTNQPVQTNGLYGLFMSWRCHGLHLNPTPASPCIQIPLVLFLNQEGNSLIMNIMAGSLWAGVWDLDAQSKRIGSSRLGFEAGDALFEVTSCEIGQHASSLDVDVASGCTGSLEVGPELIWVWDLDAGDLMRRAQTARHRSPGNRATGYECYCDSQTSS